MTNNEYKIVDEVMEKHGIIDGHRKHIMAAIRERVDRQAMFLSQSYPGPFFSHVDYPDPMFGATLSMSGYQPNITKNPTGDQQ